MRVLELCSKFGVGGIARHVIDLSQWLRAHGHHVIMAGSAGAWLDPTKDSMFTELPLNEVTEEGGGGLRRMVRAFGCAFTLRRILKQERIQLIHAHESAPAVVARLGSHGLGIPVAVTYHGSEPERVAWFGKVGRFAADRVITPSHRAAADLHQRGGIPQAKLSVIGLGIQVREAADPANVRRLRTTLLDNDSEICVVTVARLTHQKGIDILVQVVKRVLEQRRDIRFLVVGDGPQEHQAHEWAQAAGVQTHLKFTGRSEEPHLYMAAADLFLLTSRWEACR